MPPLDPNETALVRWRNRFRYALRGVVVGVRGQENFGFHFLAAIAVVAIAWLIECTRVEWLVLILCITAVLAAELFNTALEHLARAVTREEQPDIRDALDVAAGAVLVVAVGAKIVWVVVLTSRLLG